MYGVCLGELPLSKNVVVLLPDTLNCHSGSEEAIGHTKDGKDNDEDDNKGEAGLHGCGEAVQNPPPITAVAASCHTWIVVAH